MVPRARTFSLPAFWGASLIFDVGYLSINQTADALGDQGLHLLGVELTECILVLLTGLKAAVTVFFITENVILYSVRISAKFADNNRTAIGFSNLHRFKINVA